MKKSHYLYLVFLLSVFVTFSYTNHSYSQDIPPGIPLDNPFIKLGYLDVTLFGADNTGTQISTDAIQNAINTAQEYKLACYFPSGTYLVDKTLNCMLPTVWTGSKWFTDRRKPIYLLGASNPKPVIKLVNNTAGFGNPSQPKPVFRIWAQQRDGNNPGSLDPDTEQGNICMNMVIRNFEVNLSQNKGAIGIQFSGAQGSTVEDITIQADKAYSGFKSSVGQGGGFYNVEVNGGDYAFILNEVHNNKFISFTGLICRNQIKEVFKTDDVWTPMVITGFYIVKESGSLNTKWPGRGGWSLIDGIIEYTGSTPTANIFTNVTKNLYLKNVFIRNANSIINNNTSTNLNSLEWNHIIECNYTGNESQNLINGNLSAINSFLISEIQDPGNYMDLIHIHTWDPKVFISVADREDNNFINVKDEVKMVGPSGACKGNGYTNDTESLQWAIDNFAKVYLPAGTYIIDKTIKLKSNTQLLGAGKTYSILRASDSWDSSSDKIMVTTQEDAEATTCIAFIMLETNDIIHNDITRIDWHAGRNSMIRDIMVGVAGWGSTSGLPHQMFKFSGSTAGGRVYALAGEYTRNNKKTNHPEYRNILIDQTSEPLAFYGCNSERSFSDYQFEIRNSANVTIHYLKSEAGKGIGKSVPLLIRNSKNIHLYALSGGMTVDPESSLVEIKDNSQNVTVTHVRSFGTYDGWTNLSEDFSNVITKMDGDKDISLFKRNSQPTGVLKINSSEFEDGIYLYPNPFDNYLAIKNDFQQKVLLRITDSSGSLIIDRNLNELKEFINTSGLSQGIYLTKIITENSQHCFKLIKL